uniref:CKLF-like MARVEL transmembrane domain-containing protein 4 n=1 Tax=Petromyzon marinus TaxID=7757 RepID=A0AAJ7UBP5_PETMA|nr:CKLF-like MARVEL transmembrane domain-containing protein 4 [Petromyzon marinus]
MRGGEEREDVEEEAAAGVSVHAASSMMPAGPSPYQPTTEPVLLHRRGWAPACDRAYVRSPPGLVKIAQTLLDLLTFISAKSVPACSRCGALYLVEAVSFLSLLLTGALLLLFAFSLHLRLPNLNWPLLDVVNTAVWTALLFLASVLLTALGDGGSGAHVAAVTLGFLALAAYALNVLLILRRRRHHRGGGAAALGVTGVTAPGDGAPSPSAGDYTRARSDCVDDAERPGVAPSASSQDWAVDDEEVAAAVPVPTALKL